MFITNPFWLTMCPKCGIEFHLHDPLCPFCWTKKWPYFCSGYCVFENARRGDIVPGKTQFINYDLSKEDKKAVADYILQDGWIEASLHTMLEAGFRAVLDYDTKQEVFTAMVFPKGEDGPFAGYSISSRGSTAIKALAVVIWKHVVLYNGDWPKAQGGKNRPVDL